MTNTTTYTLGGKFRFSGLDGQVYTSRFDAIVGIKCFVRDEASGEYVQVLETAPDQWVDGEPQSWTTGNFETREAAKKWGWVAYRYINRNRRAAA